MFTTQPQSLMLFEATVHLSSVPRCRAIFWGRPIWGNVLGPLVLVGIALILGPGLFVLLRERQNTRALSTPFCETFSLLEAFT